jgi:hypothetical protein
MDSKLNCNYDYRPGELQTYDYRPGAVGGSADGYVLKSNALNSPRGNHHS